MCECKFAFEPPGAKRSIKTLKPNSVDVNHPGPDLALLNIDRDCQGKVSGGCTGERRRVAEALCAPMKDPNGEFAPCHRIHNPQPVYDDCVFDACQDNPRDICEIMKDYADSCATDGTSLAWRKPDRCRESCFVVVVVFVCGWCMWRKEGGGKGGGG